MMMQPARALALAVLSAATLLLTGCLLTPGTFVSELNLRRDGSFSFSYRGDVHLLGLSKLGSEAAGENQPFTPSPCHADDGVEERACSDEELAQQRKDWEAAQESARKKREEEAETMKAILGGIDPTDPKAAEEFAARLRRQSGWRSVTNKGNGRFEVDFAIAGQLDHDFVFPTMERMPVMTPFVTIVRRSDGTVRMDAPAFYPGGNPSPMLGMAEAMSQSAAQRQEAGIPELNGTFVVITDGEILANNTDEGAAASPAGKRLEWKVNARTQAAPSALLKLR